MPILSILFGLLLLRFPTVHFVVHLWLRSQCFLPYSVVQCCLWFSVIASSLSFLATAQVDLLQKLLPHLLSPFLWKKSCDRTRSISSPAIWCPTIWCWCPPVWCYTNFHWLLIPGIRCPPIWCCCSSRLWCSVVTSTICIWPICCFCERVGLISIWPFRSWSTFHNKYVF